VSEDRPYKGKRVVDLAVLAVVALPAVIVGACCALAVALSSKGPVFFRQERIGMDGRPFTVWKFRTMTRGDNPVFPEEARITRVGAVLRRFSLDELPQLINVATGDMSIVGPRPTLAYQVQRYDDHQRRRLAVRPGLTGLAQVSGRNSLLWSQRIEYDVEYVQTQSAAEDLRLIVRTGATILSGHGVEGHPGDDPLSAVDAHPGGGER
jgi:lipopolysaccharide/colanic/teichoic acid biosynthesis glycosyltransferase